MIIKRKSFMMMIMTKLSGELDQTSDIGETFEGELGETFRI